MYGRRCYYKATIAPQIYARRQTNLVADDAARVEKIDVLPTASSDRVNRFREAFVMSLQV